MEQDETEAFYGVATAVRRLFHRLSHASDSLHADEGISAGMRAILESLVAGGPQTVPQMARSRPVSRQHVQGLVNALLARGLVEYTENPGHKRSQLVAPTLAGRAAFQELRAVEERAFARLALDVSAAELDGARRVLTGLATALGSRAWGRNRRRWDVRPPKREE